MIYAPTRVKPLIAFRAGGHTVVVVEPERVAGLIGRHGFQCDGDEVDQDQRDQKAIDDKAGAIGDRPLFQNLMGAPPPTASRSEERCVGKECRSRWSPYH